MIDAGLFASYIVFGEMATPQAFGGDCCRGKKAEKRAFCPKFSVLPAVKQIPGKA